MSETFEVTLDNAQYIVDRINKYAPTIAVQYIEGGLEPFKTELRLAVLDGDFIKMLVPMRDGLMDHAWIEINPDGSPVRITFLPDQVIVDWGESRKDNLIFYKWRRQ